MSRILHLFSSELERDAAFPNGPPDGLAHAITGVGPIDAAVGSARAIAMHAPEAVVFVGTCGAYRDAGIAIGEIVVARTVRLGSGDAARGEMRIPDLVTSELACDVALGLTLAGRIASIDGSRVVPAIVSTTLGITEDDSLAARLRAHDGCDVENMEALGVAAAVAELPLAMILGVTNIVGRDGGRDWRANFRSMMARLAACMQTAPAVRPSVIQGDPRP